MITLIDANNEYLDIVIQVINQVGIDNTMFAVAGLLITISAYAYIKLRSMGTRIKDLEGDKNNMVSHKDLTMGNISFKSEELSESALSHITSIKDSQKIFDESIEALKERVRLLEDGTDNPEISAISESIEELSNLITRHVDYISTNMVTFMDETNTKMEVITVAFETLGLVLLTFHKRLIAIEVKKGKRAPHKFVNPFKDFMKDTSSKTKSDHNLT